MASLWEIGGKLISNAAGTALIECDVCPCPSSSGTVVTLCCPQGFPPTLFVTLASTCAGLNGQIVEVNYVGFFDGVEWRYEGVISSGDCAGYTVRAGLYFAGEACLFSVGIFRLDGTLCAEMESGRVDCPFVSESLTPVGIIICECCAGGTVSGDISV